LSLTVALIPLLQDFYIPVMAVGLIVGMVIVVVIWNRTADLERTAGERASEFLEIPEDSPAARVPRAVVRAPLPILESWLAVNRIRRPGDPVHANWQAPGGQPFKANWVPLIIGGMLALGSAVGVVVAIVAVVVSGTSHRDVLVPVIFGAAVTGLIGGLVLMYSASLRIARLRTAWLTSSASASDESV